jgi:hypothetical protein
MEIRWATTRSSTTTLTVIDDHKINNNNNQSEEAEAKERSKLKHGRLGVRYTKRRRPGVVAGGA